MRPAPDAIELRHLRVFVTVAEGTRLQPTRPVGGEQTERLTRLRAVSVDVNKRGRHHGRVRAAVGELHAKLPPPGRGGRVVRRRACR